MAKNIKERATVICRHEDKILFVRKPKSKWNLPGGRIEADERPGQAAVRELIEETGLNTVQLSYIAPLELYQTLHYVFETPIDPTQQPTPLNEIADCRWFSPDDLKGRNINKSVRRLLRSCLSKEAG
ncbi:8-oxo-dGTP diphosphatase [Pseudomonas nitritireducens]|uniref:8-oxo-dGTP diphosphatase n=1 Tax=Pseudomonas nitroreducens TaxID=46680 RepID=A0A7W7NYY9_PSENT|nr:NUDIX domain-containing protein [Pseudomonas nitritireducens]MBB4862208.1 8-oxo-dGTP diphosphatase [Pseudomonas nitritireducens]